MSRRRTDRLRPRQSGKWQAAPNRVPHHAEFVGDEQVGEAQLALQTAYERGGVHLVVAPVDYSENTRVLVDELHNRVPAAVRA